MQLMSTPKCTPSWSASHGSPQDNNYLEKAYDGSSVGNRTQLLELIIIMTLKQQYNLVNRLL